MNRIKNSFIAFVSLVLFLCLSVSLQAQIIYKGSSPKTPTDYPVSTGTGHMVVGDLWESFMPANKGPFSSEATSWQQYGMRQFMRHGNFDRNWSTGNGHWPIAFPWSIWWAKYLHAAIYDPDPTFCPAQIGGVINPAYEASADPEPRKGYSNYVNVTFHPSLPGANDPNRNYHKEAYFVDGPQRNHLVYEAGWPTNVGLDVKIRAHQFAAPNWNHLNDFVIIEVSFKNTGVVDLNLDGTPEKTNHKLEALSANFSGDSYMSTGSDIGGGRNQIHAVNRVARMAGYVGDEDPDGNPWNLTTMWTGTSEDPPTQMDMGLTVFQLRHYMDQYHGWNWIAAKKGGLPSDYAKGTANLEDKNNIWGVDVIGKGTQRGWFNSVGTFQGLSSWYNAPRGMFFTSIGTYYVNGGKTNNSNNVDLRPNPKFFDIAQNNVAEDILNWVPKKTTGITEAERPNGDRKLYSLDVNDAFSNVNDPDGAGYPAGWGKMSKGFSKYIDFDGELFAGIGPVSLEVGEEVTLVYVSVAGYRLEGIQKALRAAIYAYENDYVIPTPPPMPEIKVSNTLTKTVSVEWDNVAENDPQFAGYKIWKSSNHLRYNYLEDGMRIVDRYHEQMNVITTGNDAKKAERAKYAKPINPRFNAQNFINTVAQGGQYAGYTWGTWDLIAVIPKSELNNYKTSDVTPPYSYYFNDQDVAVGFKYWYYVSAYNEGTFTGPGGETTNRLETHSTNRNGANGFWQGTWPFATGNAYYDADSPTFLKNVGAAHSVTSAASPVAQLNDGSLKVGVRPNPYKKAALHDNFTNVYDHKLLFYNLPQKAKITITDVAGKIIQVIDFVSNDPKMGSYYWDMFSKDGNEIASGLYLYYIEWDGGFDKGKFAILR